MIFVCSLPSCLVTPTADGSSRLSRWVFRLAVGERAGWQRRGRARRRLGREVAVLRQAGGAEQGGPLPPAPGPLFPVSAAWAGPEGPRRALRSRRPAGPCNGGGARAEGARCHRPAGPGRAGPGGSFRRRGAGQAGGRQVRGSPRAGRGAAGTGSEVAGGTVEGLGPG